MNLGPEAVAAGYRTCEGVTRSAARNLALGIWLLPPERRRALAAVYWFSHRADQVVDSPGPPGDRAFRLAEIRAELDRSMAGDPPDAAWAALADATSRWSIPPVLYHELLDGVARDLSPAPFPDWDALREYCHGVAGVVGLIALRIFVAPAGGAVSPGHPPPTIAPDLERHAADLGYALQLTNILRDLREDATQGRWYLPFDESVRFGIARETAARGEAGPGFEALMALQVERARSLYAAGPRLVRRLPRATRACPAALVGVYRTLLERIAAEPRATLRGRIALSTSRRAVSGFLAAARALALRAEP